MIQEFKRADGFGIGSVIKKCNFDWLYKKVGQCSGEREKQATSTTCGPPKLSGEQPNHECRKIPKMEHLLNHQNKLQSKLSGWKNLTISKTSLIHFQIWP